MPFNPATHPTVCVSAVNVRCSHPMRCAQPSCAPERASPSLASKESEAARKRQCYFWLWCGYTRAESWGGRRNGKTTYVFGPVKGCLGFFWVGWSVCGVCKRLLYFRAEKCGYECDLISHKNSVGIAHVQEGGVHAMELACDVPFFLPSEGLFLVFLVVRGCLIGGCV